VIGFALEVEERNELVAIRHRVRHHALPVDAEEAAPVARVASLQNQLFVTQVQKMVKLFSVTESHNQVFAGEGFLAEVAVRVLQVDLVEQLALRVGDVVAANAVAGVHVRRQNCQKLVQQFPLHHSNRCVLFTRVPENVGDVVLLELAPPEPAFPRFFVDAFFFHNPVLLAQHSNLAEEVLNSRLARSCQVHRVDPVGVARPWRHGRQFCAILFRDFFGHLVDLVFIVSLGFDRTHHDAEMH